MVELECALCAGCGLTLAGIKAASLFNVKVELIKDIKYYKKVFLSRGVEVKYIKLNGDRLLLYVFNRSALESVLFDEENRKFLRERGYEYKSVDEALTILIKKLRFSKDFPHEIGVFLGYALEDVKGFISSPSDGVYFTGYWKVYAHAEEKACMFSRYRFCVAALERKLKSGESLERIFNIA